MLHTALRKPLENVWSPIVLCCVVTIMLWFSPSAASAGGVVVSFKTAQGKYLAAEKGGGDTVNANRTAIGIWETFVIEQYPLTDGDKISIKTAGGYYLSSESSGNLLANRSTAGNWETFKLINHSNPGGPLRHNDTVSLKSAHNKYVVAEENGAANANRGAIGPSERFTVVVHSWPETSGLNQAALDNIEARKTQYRQAILSHSPAGVTAMPILAYEGIPVKTADIEEAIRLLLTTETGDFRLATLVRVLYLTEDYDQQILPALDDLDYWLTQGEDLYCYWSENHMILWMSSAYLMQQLEGWTMDSDLQKRLLNYLNIKLKYGFYEFFSTTYLPFTLAALLNLADFADDATVRSKAAAAAKILVKNWLLVTNDKGAIFPAAGRNYPEAYTSFQPRSIAWIATGLGPMRTSSDYVGAFLSTSDIDLREAAAAWRSSVNTTFTFGHSQSEHKKIHSNLTRTDRTIFQWSSGGYFHPDVADDTSYLVAAYDLENSKHFDMFQSIPDMPDDWSSDLSTIGATFSRSSSLSQADIKIYKNAGTGLASIDNYFAGYRGYQQWPWVATVEDIAIWTQSGSIGPGWVPPSSTSANSHLPLVQQNANVAMITYFPNLEIRTAQWLDQYDTPVFLYWPKNRFDESVEWNRWILGRKGNSYVAVYRYGTETKNGFYYSSANRGRQVWAVVVGNKATHQSFANFTSIVKKASVTESFDFDWGDFRRIYRTGLDVDGKSFRSKL